MADRFFIPQPPPPGPFVLAGPEAHHLAQVRRIQAGAAIVLFCGDGFDYPALVQRVGKRETELLVEPGVPNRSERPHRLIVAAPLPKADRGGFLVEKLTELGATEYVPLLTRRSVVSPGDGKTEKLRRVVVEASKQCGRSVLLAVAPPTPLAALWSRTDLPAGRWLAEPGAPPWPAGAGGEDTLFVVGPEGGLTEEEVAAARAAGCRPAGLGPRILRIETAALALAALPVDA